MITSCLAISSHVHVSAIAPDDTIPALKKRVDLAYGRNGLSIKVPASAHVVTPP